jgi:hypothetical protein
MMKRAVLFCFLYWCSGNFAWAQGSDHVFMEGGMQRIFILNVEQGWRTMGEIGVGKGFFEAVPYTYDYGTFATLQFNFNPHHVMLGPGIMYHNSKDHFRYGAKLFYETDLHVGTVYLNTHMGYCAWWGQIYAGYNIPVMKDHMRSLVNSYTLTFSYLLD